MSETSDLVLIDEIDSAIDEIIDADSAICPAHEPMARGVVVLLRVAKVQMQQSAKTMVVAGTTSSVVSGILIAIAGFAKAKGWI